MECPHEQGLDGCIYPGLAEIFAESNKAQSELITELGRTLEMACAGCNCKCGDCPIGQALARFREWEGER